MSVRVLVWIHTLLPHSSFAFWSNQMATKTIDDLPTYEEIKEWATQNDFKFAVGRIGKRCAGCLLTAIYEMQAVSPKDSFFHSDILIGDIEANPCSIKELSCHKYSGRKQQGITTCHSCKFASGVVTISGMRSSRGLGHLPTGG